MAQKEFSITPSVHTVENSCNGTSARHKESFFLCGALLRRDVLRVMVVFASLAFCSMSAAIELAKEDVPVIVNGDKVEFFTEQEKVVAEGDVVVEYGTTTLTCDKIVVFTKTKDGFAEGHVVLRDEKGTIRGESLSFNFESEQGEIMGADFKTAPYFVRSPKAKKFPEKFVLSNADITTCNLDRPHYRMHCRSVEIFPKDKIRAKGVRFIAGSMPIMYLPIFVQDLKDRRHGFSFQPGQSREWGSYLLSAYRYYLNEEVRGLVRVDYRENKGFAYGLDLEKFAGDYGTAHLEYYFIKESLHGRGEVEPFFKNPERYKLEYRHKWDIDKATHFITEIHDFSDENFLRHYFYRQFEIDPAPRSYALLSHTYPNATFSVLLQKRFNQFFSETEKIPEVKLETGKFKLMDSSLLYYQNETSITGFTSRTRLSDADQDTVRGDVFNQLSYPFTMAFFNLEPLVGFRSSYYSKDKNGDERLLRNVFSSGFSILTKFYKTFEDIHLNAYGFELDKMRHIITPSVNYSYVHEPTLPNERLTAFDSIDSIAQANSLTLSLENKLQTKRQNAAVDFLRFVASNPYNFLDSKGWGKIVTLDLEMKPNSWLEYDSNAEFDRSRHSFRTANFDVTFPFSDDKGKVSAGYRYATGGDDSELLTFTLERQFNPKWKFRSYHRIQFTAPTSSMIEEQEYALTRDLHCWEVEFSANNKEKKGTTFWVTFRCKVFPDIGFDVDKHHQAPKNP